MSGVLIYLILIIFISLRFFNQGKNQGKGKDNSRTSSVPNQRPVRRSTQRGFNRRPLASDGHRVPRNQDISCRQYGHDHPEFDTPRFIPHEDPEDGYIILNGVKMKLSEADSYENRI